MHLAEGSVVEEVASTRKTRPKKGEVLVALRRHDYDALVVFRLDRWARSLNELVAQVEDLTSRGIQIASVHETVDTSSAMGRAMLQLVGVFAQLERDLHAEATRERLAALKRGGKRLGRPSKVTPAIVTEMRRLRRERVPYRTVAEQLDVGYGTVRRARDEPKTPPRTPAACRARREA